jgi:hypothetical protein
MKNHYFNTISIHWDPDLIKLNNTTKQENLVHSKILPNQNYLNIEKEQQRYPQVHLNVTSKHSYNIKTDKIHNHNNNPFAINFQIFSY